MTRAGSKKSRVFLSGGAGMVGRNVQDDPSAQKYEIWAPSRSEVNLLDSSATKKALADFRPDYVIHAAGRVGGIAANMAEPYAFLFENLEMGKNLIDASIQAGKPRFLNLSSSCVYPREAKNPLSEESLLTGKLEPTNEGYAIAKIGVMRLGEFAEKEGKLPFRSVVPCNLYGRYDHFDAQKSHLVPSILLKLHHAQATNAPQVEIWGTGKARREFMYAGDLATMLWRCIEKFETMPGVMNLGLGHDHSVKEYYEAAAQVLDWKGKFTHDLNRPEGMPQKLVDDSRMRAFGLSAKTTLEEGLKQTYDYFLSVQPPKGSKG